MGETTQTAMHKPKTQVILKDYQQTLVPALLLLLAGAFMGFGLPLPKSFWILWAVVSVMCFLGVLFCAPRLKTVRWFLWLLCLCLGGLWYSLFHFQPGAVDIAADGDQPRVVMTGTVCAAQGKQWIVEAQRLNGKTVTGRVLLKPSNTVQQPLVPLHVGDRVEVHGALVKPHSAKFPGDFDYRAYLLQQRMTALLYANRWVVQGHAHTPWLSLLAWTDGLRQQVTSKFQAYLPPDEANILASVVLGEHAVGLDPTVKQRFVRAGLVHTLAASGMNVGLISLVFLGLGRVLRLPLRLSLGITMVGVAFYCLLTGLPPSVQRAGMMLELAFLLKMIRRELTPVTLLCVAAVVLVAIQPMTIAMIGFQLSFFSTFGLLTMVPPLQERLGFYITRWGAGLILVPLVAQLWVTPLLWYYFNQVQLVSLPANLLALPLVAVLTYAGFLLGGLSLVMPQAVEILLGWLHGPVWLFQQIAQFFGTLPFAVLTVPTLPLASVMLLFGMLMGLTYALYFPVLPSKKAIWATATACLLLCLAPFSLSKWLDSQWTRVVWIPHRYGASSQVIETPHRRVWVNVAKLTPWTARDIQAYLHHRGITHIDVLNLASPRMQNLAGLSVLLEQFSLGTITTPGLVSDKAQAQLVQQAGQYHGSLLALAPTHQLQQDGLHATFYTAAPEETLQKIQTGSQCVVLHWGHSPLAESPLALMGQQCAKVFEIGPTLSEPRSFQEIRLPTLSQGGK